MMNHGSFGIRSSTALALLVMAMIGASCALDQTESDADPAEMDLGAAQQGVGGDPGVGNRLTPRCLEDHGVQYDTRNLATGPIRAMGYSLPVMPHMPSASATGDLAGCRRTFLDILISCALPQFHTVSDPGDLNAYGTPRNHAGLIGLAPDWETRALTTEEKQIITACVMGRTNLTGEVIPVLLEGNHPAITPSSADYTAYPVADATFWGNMFDSTVALTPDGNTYTPPPFAGHVCQNDSVGLCNDASYRLCDEGVDCGFTPHGDCDDVASACTNNSGRLWMPPSYCIGRSNQVKVYLEAAGDACIIPLFP